MNINNKILDILFRQPSPAAIWKEIVSSVTGSSEGSLSRRTDMETFKKNIFMDYAETRLHGYSIDEQEMLFRQIGQQRKLWEQKTGSDCDFLFPLLACGEEYLTVVAGEPRCRQERVLDWRDAYLYVGQDILTCVYLASQDHCKGLKREDFSWPMIRVRFRNQIRQLI